MKSYYELVDRFQAGFDNYNKIAILDLVRVSKFWRTSRTWTNTKKHTSGAIPFT